MSTCRYGTLFVPDSNSFLRDSDSCLGNDDKWLSVRASFGVQAEGLHFLHPSLGLSTALQLSIPMISTVLTEKLIPFTKLKIGVKRGDSIVKEHSLKEVAKEGSSREHSMAVERTQMEDKLNNLQMREDIWDPKGTAGEDQMIFRIGNALRSEDFIRAISALSNDVDNNAVNKRIALENEKDREGSNKDEISIQCSSLKLRFVDSLPIQLVLKDTRRIPLREVEILEDPSKETDTTESLFYTKQEQFGEKTLFVNTSLLTSYLTHEVAVSIGLCSILGLANTLATSIACLLCAPLGERDSVLLALRVGCDPLEASEMLRGVPGEFVIDTDLQLLELKPFRIFRQGEVVAYESKGMSDISTKATKNIPTTEYTLQNTLKNEIPTSEVWDPFSHLVDKKDNIGFDSKRSVQVNDSNNSDDFDNTIRNINDNVNKGDYKNDCKINGTNNCMRYARVISTGQIGEEELAVRKILVKISNLVSKPMLATQIFSFQSARDVATRKNATANASINTGIASSISKSKIFSALTPTLVKSSTSGSASTLGPVGGQPVSQKEIIEAINELHMRAGLPLSPDERNLMSRVVELESLYKRSQMEVLTERSLLSDAREALTQASSVKKCQICVCNDISHVMVPCGEYILICICLSIQKRILRHIYMFGISISTDY